MVDAIEEIGKYHPPREPSLIDIDLDRANTGCPTVPNRPRPSPPWLKKHEEGTVRVGAETVQEGDPTGQPSPPRASPLTTPPARPPRARRPPKKEGGVAAEVPAEASAEVPADAEVARPPTPTAVAPRARA